ncbi:hypothetical protein GOV07_03480 [Candidatus Woesearchaeota archaeon]|nr:hypothetical protein [Candidatus Woesearchaeota archaeon]
MKKRVDQWSAWIKQMRQQGYSDDQLRQTLLQQGYVPEQVNALLAPQSAIPTTPKKKKGSKGVLILVFLVLILSMGVIVYFLLPFSNTNEVLETNRTEEATTGQEEVGVIPKEELEETLGSGDDLEEISKSITDVETGNELVSITFRGSSNDITTLKGAMIMFLPATQYDGEKIGGMIGALQPLTFEEPLKLEMQYTEAALELTRVTKPSFLEQDLAIVIIEEKKNTFLDTIYVKEERKLTAELTSFPAKSAITIMQKGAQPLEDYQNEGLTIEDFCNEDESADCITIVAAYTNEQALCNQLSGTEKNDCLQQVELLNYPTRACEIGASGMLSIELRDQFYKNCADLSCTNTLENTYTKCNDVWDVMCVTCVACYCGE